MLPPASRGAVSPSQEKARTTSARRVSRVRGVRVARNRQSQRLPRSRSALLREWREREGIPAQLAD